MSDHVNVDPLVGRHFVSKSGNVARVERIRWDIVGVRWSGEPHSLEDEEEFDAWAKSILESTGGPYEFHSTGENRESLEDFMKRIGKGNDGR